MIRLLALATVFASAAAPRDLYLLIGQSNMAGRGVVTDANRLSSKGVLKFTEKGQWAEGVEPIHYDRPTVGAGPGLAFARAMVDGTDVEIGLVPCAEGGSPLKRWEPGKDLYTNAVARMKAALATGGRLRGILWHQGEADSWTKENASTYGVRLTNMVTRLRAELGAKYVPFLAGEVGLHYATSIAKRGGKPFVSLVNRQIKEAVSHLPAAGWVSAEGLEPGPDGIHFTTESAYELGRRYAREMTRWQSVPDQALEGVDYGGAAADWKPSATAYGFNLQGMRMAGPHVGFKSDYFKWLADWGFNFVRLPLDYRCWVKDRKSANREFIDERGLEPLDAGIAAARRNGVTVMICLHRIPGEYCVQVRDPEPGNIYADPDCLSAAVKHWSLLAARYRDVPRENLYFNLINEPSAQMGTRDQYEYVCRVLAAAIRKVDPKRFIVADGWPSGSFPVPGLYDVPGIGQATRGYYPMGFTHFGMTPGLSPQHDTATAYPPVWPLRRDRPDGRLGGPRWKDWRDPFIVEDSPAGDYELALAMVSGPVTVAVETNGVPCAAFPLEPKLNDADWQALSRYRGVGALRGEYRKTLRFTLPTSVRTLAIRVREGDWAMPRVLVARSEGRELRLDFGGNMKAMKNVRWNRRFVGWDAASPLPAVDGPVAPAFYADEGMDAIAGGNLEPWRETVKKGIWCMVGEFGCANHVAHADALRFLDSNLKLFRELGLGWAAWGFSGSRFGILNSCRADVDYEDWHGEKLDRKMLELLQRQVKVPATGKPAPPTFAEFLARYKRDLNANADRLMAIVNESESHLAEIHPALVLSLAIDSALERGVDAFSTGMTYNYSAVGEVGFASAVDSLLAVKELVYEDGEKVRGCKGEKVSLKELGEILRKDWAGHEELRLRAVREAPKWGRGEAHADRLAAEVIESMTRHIVGKPNGRGGKWTVYGLHSRAYIEFGRDSAASPDGRLRGEHLSKNVAPSTGAETEGITGTLKSYAKIRPENFPCGSVLDVMINPASVRGEKGLQVFRSLVDYWMVNGGTALNVNILSAEELRDAQRHPEKYENLQVRVAGWNVRWLDIPKREQDDFIRRAESVGR